MPTVRWPDVDNIRVSTEARPALAAGHPVAAREGIRVLEAGGSAADAAIATAFVQGVVEPSAGAALYVVARGVDGALEAAADPRRPGGST